MGRSKKSFPSPEAGAAETSPPEVRQQIKQMTGHASAEEMADSLPMNTMIASEEETPRRKRRSKEEIAASRAGTATSSTDPNMVDPFYREAIEDMRAFGGGSIIKGGFSTMGVALHDEKIPLTKKEEKRLDGYFYVMSKKYNVLDPSNHWFTMALYFFGMLGSFIFARIAEKKGEDMTQQVMRWLGMAKDEEKKEPGE